jgi:hypothetical protein
VALAAVVKYIRPLAEDLNQLASLWYYRYSVTTTFCPECDETATPLPVQDLERGEASRRAR